LVDIERKPTNTLNALVDRELCVLKDGTDFQSGSLITVSLVLGLCTVWARAVLLEFWL
jgi:hypothetical protein